jgi:hypothetical protein
MARKIRQQICANCNHSFNEGENFCPNCGQENHSPNQPIRHYTAELIESTLHLDSKVLLTIKTMLMYPGKITRDYNDNMRARFTPPVRLYIFISFVFFVLLQFPSTIYKIVDHEKAKSPVILDGPHKEQKLKDESSTITRDSLQDTIVTENILGLKINMSKAEMLKFKNAKPEQIDSLILSQNKTPNYFNRTLIQQILKSYDADESFTERIKEKSIKFGSISLFFLMPFFAFLVYLAYFNRKKYYYEYLIFSLHYHTVIFLFSSIIILLSIFFSIPGWINFFVALGLLYYLGKALRYNFQGSRWRTILRMMAICSIYSITLLIVSITVIFLGWWFV